MVQYQPDSPSCKRSLQDGFLAFALRCDRKIHFRPVLKSFWNRPSGIDQGGVGRSGDFAMRARDHACGRRLGRKALAEMFKLIESAAKGITALLQVNGHERLQFLFSCVLSDLLVQWFFPDAQKLSSARPERRFKFETD